MALVSPLRPDLGEREQCKIVYPREKLAIYPKKMNDFRTGALSHAALQYRVHLMSTSSACEPSHEQSETDIFTNDNVACGTNNAAYDSDEFLVYIHQLQDSASRRADQLKELFYRDLYGDMQGSKIAETERLNMEAQRKAIEECEDGTSAEGVEDGMSDLDYQILLARAGIFVSNDCDRNYASLLRQVLSVIPPEDILSPHELSRDRRDCLTQCLRVLHSRISSCVAEKAASLDKFGESETFFLALKQAFLTRERLDGIYVDEQNDSPPLEVEPDETPTVAEKRVKRQVVAKRPAATNTSRPPTRSFKKLLEEIRQQQEEECVQYSFKSRSIPKSSLNSSYAQIMAEAKLRRETLTKKRIEQLASSVKPFSFTELKSYKKSEKKSLERSDSPRPHTAPAGQTAKKSKSKSMRLAASAAEDGRQRTQRLLELEERAGITENHTFTPKINHQIPNFKKAQQEFESQLSLAKRRLASSLPPCKPFRFTQRGEHLLKSKTEAEESAVTRERETLEKFRWPHHSPLPLPVADLSNPGKQFSAKMTRSIILKQQSRQFELEKQQLVQKMLDEDIRRRSQKISSINKKLAAFLKPRNELLMAAHENKNYERLMAARQQENAYWDALNDIYDRLENRPLIVDG